VYNHEYNITRLVDITPSRQWGGQGALGCTLGYGALHRIPPPLDEPPDAPGDTIFDTSTTEEKQGAPNTSTTLSDSADFVVPAEQFSQASVPNSAAQPKEERRVRHHAHISPSAEMDEYFREGEQRSKEEDNAPTPNPKTGIPPPPKAGVKHGHSKGSPS
jgi:GRASP55/65 PDZ-like domain